MNFNKDSSDESIKAMHARRLIQRDIDQLLGICEFALQDGLIEQEEAESILVWLSNHNECLNTWPANILYERLIRMLDEGILDQEEQREILSLIMSIAKPTIGNKSIPPCTLPLDDPAPEIVFKEKSFCFTGVFEYGSRAECQQAIITKQGNVTDGITKKLNYLVIGNIGSEVWRHSSFGAKIAKAVEYKEKGIPIIIVSETHWRSLLK